MKMKTKRASRRQNATSRAESYRAYRARLRAGFTNPLNPGGESSDIRATHIDRFGCRYQLPSSEEITAKTRGGVPLLIQFYRPSLRQRLRGCDACSRAHVETNVYCRANDFCTRETSRLDASAKFMMPTPNADSEEILHSLVPERFPTYKASCLEFHIIGKNCA